MIALLGWLGAASAVQAKEFVVPPLRAAVTDQAGMLSPATRNKLEESLQRFRDQGGAQIAVLTLPNLSGLTIEEASIRIVDEWKLGSSEKDDGILLLLAKQERKVRIEVGQGLEGNLPDAYAKRVIDEGITPLFKQGDIDGGVLVGVYQIAQRTNPEIDMKGLLEGRTQPRRNQQRQEGGSPWLSLFIFFIIVPLNLMRMGLFGSSGYRRGHSGYYWGGGGGGGFSGGGGFGGGGGGFSGGGASGGW